MPLSPDEFRILGHVLQQGAAAERTLAWKYPPKSVRSLIDRGYLHQFGKGFVGLSKAGRKAISGIIL